MTDELLKVRVISPRQDLFAGQALSVSSVNSVGPFDILPEHAKFVTLVENQKVVLRLVDKTIKEFSFGLAIIHVHENQVNIFINPKEAGQGLTDAS